jgi:hypothetical protein
MPRDIHIAAPRALAFSDLVAAAAEVDASLVVRGLFHGSVIQLVNADDEAILTVENSRQLLVSADARRIAPDLVLPVGDLWWIEATAPWGTTGTAGVAVTEALALILHGSTVVEDGS